jgi:hypothetical protein
MVYRFQFILHDIKDIQDLFDRFDMYPSMVAWNGHTTYFCEQSVFAYKYMMNVINRSKYS